MGLFKRLNARILAILSKRSGAYQIVCVAVADEQMFFTLSNGNELNLNFTDLKRVIALRRDLYTTEEVCLLLEFSSRPIIEILESCQGWKTLCATIDKLQNAKPFSLWYPQILCAPVDQVIEIWPIVD